MAISSFSILFTENFAVKVQTSNGTPIPGAQVTITGGSGSQQATTNSDGMSYFILSTSETLTISVLFDGTVQTQTYAYTYSASLTVYIFSFPLPLRYTQANANNFVRWYKPNEVATLEDARDALVDCVIELSDQSTRTRKPSRYSLYSQLSYAQLVIVQNVPFSFYANLDTLESSANFADWRVDIVTEDLFTIQSDVFNLTKDIISGSDYRFYAEDVIITVGNQLTTGETYRFVIIDSTDESIVYLGNLWQYQRFQPTYHEPVKAIKYRNNRDIFNYNYSGLLTFYNEYYIKVHSGAKRPVTGQEGYEVIDGSFQPVRATTGAEFTFVTQSYDKEDHAAFNAVTLHGEFYIVVESGYQQFNRGTNDYGIDYGDLRYPLADGEITLQQKPSFNSNKLL